VDMYIRHVHVSTTQILRFRNSPAKQDVWSSYGYNMYKKATPGHAKSYHNLTILT
jgi:hypothetical protein